LAPGRGTTCPPGDRPMTFLAMALSLMAANLLALIIFVMVARAN
jgi:hypothetical protein